MHIRIITLLFVLLNITSAYSKVELPAIISDNMMLQQNWEAKLWGKASPNRNVTIVTSWNNSTYRAIADNNGLWEINVATEKGGGPYTITFDDGDIHIVNNVLLGEVWLISGQSNMEMSFRGLFNQPVYNPNDAMIAADDSNVRLFRVPRNWSAEPQFTNKGYWTELSDQSAETFSVAGYYFANILRKKLKVPVGILAVYWGGSSVEAWTSRESLSKLLNIQIPDIEITNKNANCIHTLLYNGMIAPIEGYGIRGCLWYQGEANVVSPDNYEDLFCEMVNDWRTRWGYTFPFYYAQIAPYSYNNSMGIDAALLREAQLKSSQRIQSSGMISLVDHGEEDCIHPKNKEIVGKRFAYWALSKTYNVAGIESHAPIYKALEIEESKALLTFDYAKYGLTSYLEELQGFEIAGEDKIFHPAKAKIRKGIAIVEVSSAHVSQPVAVRYCFRNYAYGNLYNSYGMPSPSFRTDNW